jgi:hypothetical protein
MFEDIFMELVKARIARGGALSPEVLDQLVIDADGIETRCATALRAREQSKPKPKLEK